MYSFFSKTGKSGCCGAMSAPLGEARALQFTTVPTTPACPHLADTLIFVTRLPCGFLPGEQVGWTGPSPGQATNPNQPGCVGVRTWPPVVLLPARAPSWESTTLLSIGD